MLRALAHTQRIRDIVDACARDFGFALRKALLYRAARELRLPANPLRRLSEENTLAMRSADFSSPVYHLNFQLVPFHTSPSRNGMSGKKPCRI